MALLLFFIASLALAQNITCPILVCNSPSGLVPGVCYSHDGNVPTKQLSGAQCQTTGALPTYCPFDPLSDEYSWVVETL
jgi:hypothetical protein